MGPMEAQHDRIRRQPGGGRAAVGHCKTPCNRQLRLERSADPIDDRALLLSQQVPSRRAWWTNWCTGDVVAANTFDDAAAGPSCATLPTGTWTR